MGTKIFRSRRANLTTCEDNLGMHASQPATESWSNRAFYYSGIQFAVPVARGVHFAESNNNVLLSEPIVLSLRNFLQTPPQNKLSIFLKGTNIQIFAETLQIAILLYL